ncbi:maker510 [Drosophila busckii]|uniref:Maker510 n=1 Tax=Drosophila busckii TaxID=30019 RepID=A0A0M4ED31_DROBS|nr:maker510 [Drosophila busckii]
MKDQAKPQTESEQIHELQTELEVQKNNELKNSLLNDRDKLKEEDTSKPNKFVKQAEATSCVPFGYSNDIQTIRLLDTEAFQVSCDSRFAGNGWTIIQRRIDGAVHFNRSWHEYRKGFGNLRAEFWLGLEKLHRITNYQPHELYIHMEDFRNQTRYARYSNFSIGTEQQSYELTLGEYAGTAGNSLIYHKNVKFFTQEHDNNLRCAAQAKSGWWFTNCYRW